MSFTLAQRLLDWYDQHARQLPWRTHPEPYRVLVSEIMLQQTRVETVLPYFERWMERFPDVQALAAASQQEVLAAWEGLGYYSRARSLHRAAQQVVEKYGGQIPSEMEELRSLPGVGPYTAAAIASIAFQRDEAALDGNIRRVLARVFNVEVPARSPQGDKILWELARENLPPDRAGDYNQALMDLGASICTPRRPGCPVCPLESGCQARLLGIQEQRPVKLARREVPHYLVTAAVIWQKAQVLITLRPQDGLLGGMWEFPGGKLQEGEDLPTCLQREIGEELGVEIVVLQPVGVYRHAYTHYRVTLHAFHSRIVSGDLTALQVADFRWVSVPELSSYPMGKIDRLIAKDLQSL
jgi:A/G-specific adenine glycosylase